MNDMVDWADVAAIAVIARKFGENRPADIMVLAFEEIAAAGIRYAYNDKCDSAFRRGYDIGNSMGHRAGYTAGYTDALREY